MTNTKDKGFPHITESDYCSTWVHLTKPVLWMVGDGELDEEKTNMWEPLWELGCSS